MPETTTRLYAIQSALVDSSSPEKNFYDSNILYAEIYPKTNQYKIAYLSFERSAELMRRKILQISFFIYCRQIAKDYVTTGLFRGNKNQFDEKTITYSNRPDIDLRTRSEVFSIGNNFSWKKSSLQEGYYLVPYTNALVLRNGVACEAQSVLTTPPYVEPYGIEFYGVRTDYCPYIEVISIEAEITAKNLIPAEGAFVDKKKLKKFGWEVGYDVNLIPEKIGQKNARFRWRPKGTTAYTEITINGSSTEYIMPANTVSSNQFEWQVVIVSDDDVESPPSPWVTLTTVDSIPAANPISPINTYVETDQPNIFTWQHIIDTGSPASKSELQYSVDKTLWNALATVTGSALTVTIPAGTLPIGRVWWRVRTYNTDNAAGSWSELAALVVRGRPRPPSISSITNESRPEIRWQSASQAAYWIQILDSSETIIVDTKEAYGADKAYNLNEYLPIGAYSVRIKIKASNGLWSDWAQSGFTISASSSVAPQVVYTPVDGGVQIQVTNASSFAKLYLLRNGKPIAKIAAAYTDYTAEISQYYTVRGVNVEDNFADSAPELVRSKITMGARLAAVSDLSSMITLYLRRNEPVSQETSTEHLGMAVYYAGRENPVYHYSEFNAQNTNMEFAVKSREQYRDLLKLLDRKETILYRDLYGEKFYCAVPAISDTRDHLGVTFTLPMQRVDYKETILYDKKVVT